MSSVISSFEYDIFISYRHNDNRSGWVTDFVSALQEELAATIKEPVSVYFDTNPHDGLLEIHNVDKSLEGKLKCLIFIPIISQTYCDPKSFAWQHEFCAFNQLAKEDQSGRDIKLSSGNVASRILPVKIHDLDQADKVLLENELAGVLRSIDFIFKSSGVNRPLKPDDSRPENVNHTYYRDQINKVANAVKEIITGLKNFDDEIKVLPKERALVTRDSSRKMHRVKVKTLIWIFIFIVLVVSGYFLLPALSKTSLENIDKSIAVLPFVNMSNDREQEYFSDGMMQEILNHLFKIGGLKISPGTSSLRYKRSQLSVKQIARELGASYVLEGYVSKSPDKIKITVRLIKGKNEHLIWSEEYQREFNAFNIFDIQSDVAQQVANNMKVVINPEVKIRIEAKPTLNTEAYTLVLQANINYLPFSQARTMLERAISLDPQYADAYALLAYYWVHRGGYNGNLTREQVIEKVAPLLNKTLNLNDKSLLGHTVKAMMSLYYYWDFNSVENEFQLINQLYPSSSESDLKGFFSDYLLACGRFNEALKLTENSVIQNSNTFLIARLAMNYYFVNQPQRAQETLDTAFSVSQDVRIFILIELSNYEEKFDNAKTLFETHFTEKKPEEYNPRFLGTLGIIYFKTGNKQKSDTFLHELLVRSTKSSVGSPSFYAAAVYAAKADNDNAILALEKAFNDHEVEMYWLKVEPLFKPLHGDPRFEYILRKIGFK